jgi:hypothetical protein
MSWNVWFSTDLSSNCTEKCDILEHRGEKVPGSRSPRRLNFYGSVQYLVSSAWILPRITIQVHKIIRRLLHFRQISSPLLEKLTWQTESHENDTENTNRNIEAKVDWIPCSQIVATTALAAESNLTNKHILCASSDLCKRKWSAVSWHTIMFIYSYMLRILNVHVFPLCKLCSVYSVFIVPTDILRLTWQVFPCFFLSCKANAKAYLAKTGHGPHSS